VETGLCPLTCRSGGSDNLSALEATSDPRWARTSGARPPPTRTSMAQGPDDGGEEELVEIELEIDGPPPPPPPWRMFEPAAPASEDDEEAVPEAVAEIP